MNKIIFSNSYIKSTDGVDYLNLREENYYQTGLAAGNLFVKSNYKIIKLLKNPFVRIILWFLNLRFKNQIQEIKVPREYQDELMGCAEGTKIPYKYLVLINLIYEIRGCSGFAFFNPDGSLLLAHNTDVSKILAKIALHYLKPLVADVTVSGKNNFVHIALPLMLGAINGFNDKGIAVSSHDAGGVSTKIVKDNTSTACLVKMVLENAKNLTDVQKITKENLAYYPGIMIVASAQERKAFILEAHPLDFDFVPFDVHPYIFSANHYQSVKMRRYHREIKRGSLDRLTCLQGSLSGKTSLSVQEAIEILKDARNGVQRDTTGYSIANIGTFQSFVFDMRKKAIYISNGRKTPVSLYGSFIEIAARP